MEVNNLYNEDHRVLHLVDRCTRWQATTEVPDKKEETLMGAIEKIWIGIFGPPKELLAAGDAAGQGILIAHMLHEIERGPVPLSEARDRRMKGYVPTALYLDA